MSETQNQNSNVQRKPRVLVAMSGGVDSSVAASARKSKKAEAA